MVDATGVPEPPRIFAALPTDASLEIVFRLVRIRVLDRQSRGPSHYRYIHVAGDAQYYWRSSDAGMHILQTLSNRSSRMVCVPTDAHERVLA